MYFDRQKNGKAQAFVIGLDCATGLQTARILTGHGVPVIGVAAHPGHPCCRTRACERIHFVPTTTPELIEALERLGRGLEQKAVLFPCTDMTVLLLSRHRRRLLDSYHIVLPEPDVVEMLVDKGKFYAFAEREGLPIPATLSMENRTDAKRAARELAFPCVLKPELKTPVWESNTSAKAFMVETPEELLAVYERCAAWSARVVAQEWIGGPDSNLFTCNGYFDSASQPLVTFTTRKLRQWPPKAGTGCLGEECRSEVLVRETVRLFQRVRHRGLGYLEMKLDPRRDRYFICEPNIGRPTGRSATAEAAGVELLYTMYCDALGLPLPVNREQKFVGAKWVYLRRDLQASYCEWRRGDLTLSGWMRSLRDVKTEALFSWSDPLPFLLDFRRPARQLLAELGLGRSLPSAVNHRGDGPAKMESWTKMKPKTGPPTTAGQRNVDFDLHGLVGIRLVNPSANDAAAARRQLGPLENPIKRDPDIVVRFVNRLVTPGLRFVHMGRSGFTDDGFYILQSGKRAAKVRMAFEHAGGPCELVCESGLRAIPLLLPLIHLALLKKDCVAAHASAFVHGGTGVLVTGWANGGKTGALLAFSAHGARYVGDEWVILSGNGQRMYGIPEHMHIGGWHCDNIPRLRRLVPGSRRLLFHGVHWLDRIEKSLSLSGLTRWFPGSLLSQALPALRRRLNAQLDPQAVFGSQFGPLVAAPERVFFLLNAEGSQIEVEPADPAEIAERMALSVRHEQLPFLEHYLGFCFAFPEKRNSFLEYAHQLQAEVLQRALQGKQAFVVRHPNPCRFSDLYAAMQPYCGSPERVLALPQNLVPPELDLCQKETA